MRGYVKKRWSWLTIITWIFLQSCRMTDESWKYSFDSCVVIRSLKKIQLHVITQLELSCSRCWQCFCTSLWGCRRKRTYWERRSEWPDSTDQYCHHQSRQTRPSKKVELRWHFRSRVLPVRRLGQKCTTQCMNSSFKLHLLSRLVW